MRISPFIFLFLNIFIFSCNYFEDQQSIPKEMNVDNINVPVEIIGNFNGTEIKAYTIKNANNYSMTVLNYGGIVQKFEVPNKNGKLVNIVLGFDQIDGYTQDGNPYFGALIGRYSNRIENGSFKIGEREYQLTKNNDGNTLHSGEVGFHNVFWEVEPLSNASLLLKYISPDGQEGFPGNVTVEVIYILTDDNEWIIDYNAKTEKATPISFTQHTYFNLEGLDSSENVLNHTVQILANEYTPVNEKMIPTGEILKVNNTPFDFRNHKLISKDINFLKGGYDHNLIFDKKRSLDQPVAKVHDSASGISLTMYTTEPAIQFFTAGVLDGTLKNTTHHKEYKQFAGFCLEAQRFPNSPNQINFPDAILLPGETYFQKTIYRIGVE